MAVPIYQTAAYQFDSADHGAALFNLEAGRLSLQPHRQSHRGGAGRRASRRWKARAGALATASGQAALYYAFANVAQAGSNIVSTPQLYGTTHTLLHIVLPGQGVEGRFAAGDSAEALAACIDENTRAVFCETVGNPAGNICDIEAIARMAHAHGIPLIVDNTVATPVLLKPAEHGADIIVHSLTKFMGGHGSAMGGMVVDAGNFDWMANAARFPQFTTPDHSYHGLVYAERFGQDRLRRARPQRLSAHHRRHPVAHERLPAAAGHRDRQPAHRAPCRECPQRGGIPARRSPRGLGAIMPASRKAPITRWRRNIWTAARPRC